MKDWNIWWTIAEIKAWVILPGALISAKLYQDWSWKKKFGETKPR